MSIVAGVDFGTLSVRVSIVDSERGLLASAVAEYPLHRKREDPDFATQSHEDHMRALAEATRAGREVRGHLRRSDRIHCARHHRIQRHSGRRRHGPARRLLPVVRSPRQAGSRANHGTRAHSTNSRPSNGAAASTPPNGDSPSCCTGCATIQTSARNSSAPSSTATWSRPRCAASPMPAA